MRRRMVPRRAKSAPCGSAWRLPVVNKRGATRCNNDPFDVR